MKLQHRNTGARWAITLLVAGALTDPNGEAGQRNPEDGAALQSLLNLQRSYEVARYRREPVTSLLAHAFVEIQHDGRVLTRDQAIAKYARFDDPSGRGMDGRWTAMYGDIAIIGGRTGEEGTSYQAKRLCVWSKENQDWRLLVFQGTFERSPQETLQASPSTSPFTVRQQQIVPSEEEILARRDVTVVGRIVSDTAKIVDRYGRELTGRAWVMQLTERNARPSTLRDFSILVQGETTVIVGTEVSGNNGEVDRFTRIWRGVESMQLHVSQLTPTAIDSKGP